MASLRKPEDNLQVYFQQTWNQCFRHQGETLETEQPSLQGDGKWWYNVCAFAPLLHSKIFKTSLPLVQTSFSSYATFCLKQRTCCVTSLKTQIQHTGITWLFFGTGPAWLRRNPHMQLVYVLPRLRWSWLVAAQLCSRHFKTRLCKTDKHDDSAGVAADAMFVLGGGVLVLRILYNVSWHC